MNKNSSSSGEGMISTDYSNSAAMISAISPSSAHPLSLASQIRNNIWFGAQFSIARPVTPKPHHKETQQETQDLAPEGLELYLHNIQHREPEPEDVQLVASGILQKLLTQAKQEPPTDDWEQELAEL